MADQLDRLKTSLADRYTIEREIGSGGMATVCFAEGLKLHRMVAFAVIPTISEESGGPSRELVRGCRGAGFKARRTKFGGVGQCLVE